MRRPLLTARFAVAVTAIPLILSACSITITANQAPSEEAVATASGSAAPTPDASEAAVIDEAFHDFCAEEAVGSLDLIMLMEDEANTAIADGIAQSIAQQQMNEAQAADCEQAWVETLAENGITYDAGPADLGEPAASSEPAPSES